MGERSVESCTRKITSLEPFVLECGHYPDRDFRGGKQIGESFLCIGCYRGEPPTAPRPETQVSDETRILERDACALLEANPMCPLCGGRTIVRAATKKRAAYLTCAAECEKNARMREREAIEDSGEARHNSPSKVSNAGSEDGAIVSPLVEPAPAPRGTGGLDIAAGAPSPRENEKEPMTQLATTDTRTIPYALDPHIQARPQREAESAQALAISRDARVTSPEALDWATGATKHAKDWIDYLDAEREKLNRPLLDEKARVDEVFMPAIKNWREVERVLKAGMGSYHLAQRAEQERVMRESAAVYQQGGTPIAPVPVVVQGEGIGVRETWQFEITNANLVPRELCSPDPSKIEVARSMWMQGAGEPPAIPGVRFFKAADVRVRRK